jgi:site-specific recombinase XerD
VPDRSPRIKAAADCDRAPSGLGRVLERNALCDCIDSADCRAIPRRRSFRTDGLTFRRTYSSWSHDKGVPGKVIAQLMGHAAVDTTLNIYTQVLDGSVRAAVEAVGGELFTIVH